MSLGKIGLANSSLAERDRTLGRGGESYATTQKRLKSFSWGILKR
jgi:hypothetical protein